MMTDKQRQAMMSQSFQDSTFHPKREAQATPEAREAERARLQERLAQLDTEVSTVTNEEIQWWMSQWTQDPKARLIERLAQLETENEK